MPGNILNFNLSPEKVRKNKISTKVKVKATCNIV